MIFILDPRGLVFKAPQAVIKDLLNSCCGLGPEVVPRDSTAKQDRLLLPLPWNIPPRVLLWQLKMIPTSCVQGTHPEGSFKLRGSGEGLQICTSNKFTGAADAICLDRTTALSVSVAVPFIN